MGGFGSRCVCGGCIGWGCVSPSVLESRDDRANESTLDTVRFDSDKAVASQRCGLLSAHRRTHVCSVDILAEV